MGLAERQSFDGGKSRAEELHCEIYISVQNSQFDCNTVSFYQGAIQLTLRALNCWP